MDETPFAYEMIKSMYIDWQKYHRYYIMCCQFNKIIEKLYYGGEGGLYGMIKKYMEKHHRIYEQLYNY